MVQFASKKVLHAGSGHDKEFSKNVCFSLGDKWPQKVAVGMARGWQVGEPGHQIG